MSLNASFFSRSVRWASQRSRRGRHAKASLTGTSRVGSGCRSLRLEPLEDRSLLSVSVVGRVWNDVDGNGIRDVQEKGLPGAVVELRRSVDDVVGNADDVSCGIAVMDSSGRYSFDDLPEGAGYYEIFRAPVGYAFTTQHACGDIGFDSDPDASGTTDLFAVAAGATEDGHDAGLVGSTPDFGWAFNVGVLDKSASGNSIATDAAGNVYVAGSFSGTTDFDPGPGIFNLTSSDYYSDAFVAKYTSAGALLWARGLGENGNNRGDAIAVAADESVFVATSHFESSTGYSSFHYSSSIRKLDRWGNDIWTRYLAVDSGVYSIATAPDGGIWIAGNGGEDIAWVSKWNAAGENTSTETLSGTGRVRVYDVAVGADGSVYAAGYIVGTADIAAGGHTSTLTSLTNGAFLSKLDATGHLAWAKCTDNGANQIDALAVDDDGCVYTLDIHTGVTSSVIDGNSFSGTIQLTFGCDLYVSKRDSNGSVLWSQLADHTSSNGFTISGVDQLHGDIAMGGNGTVLCVGSSLCRLDSDGAAMRRDSVPGTGIAVAPDGSIYTTGSFQGVLGDPSEAFHLTSNGCDAFVWKRSPQTGPTDISLASNRVAVDVPVGTRVGDLATRDAWGESPFSYELVPGEGDDDNDSFQIIGGQLRTSELFDADGKSSLSIRVRTTDLDGLFFEKTFVIAVAEASHVGYVRGVVWNDLDGDGIRDPEEPNVAGAVAEVYSSTDDVVGNEDDALQDCFVSDAEGRYAFGGLPLGTNLYVVFRAPVAYTFTVQAVGGVSTVDSDPNASGVTDLFVLPDGESAVTLDAGLVGSTPDFGWALGVQHVVSNAVAVDDVGDVYVTGSYSADADFDPGPGVVTLASSSGKCFLAKYASSGALLWATTIGPSCAREGVDVSVGPDGCVYVVGDSSTGYALSLPGTNDTVFVSKYEPTGDLVWTRYLQASNTPQVSATHANAIAVGEDGAVCITGVFSGGRSFAFGAPGSVGQSVALVNNGGGDIFILKIDGDGNFLWAKSIGGAGNDEGCGIDVDKDGNVYATGWIGEDSTVVFDSGDASPSLIAGAYDAAFVLKLDPTGRFVWAKRMGGGYGAHAYDIAVTDDGSVYTAGWFSGSVDFDPGPAVFNLAATDSSTRDVFVAKLDPQGDFAWATSDQTGTSVNQIGIALGDDGDAYLTYHTKTVASTQRASVAGLDSVASSGTITIIPPLPSYVDSLAILAFTPNGALAWRTATAKSNSSWLYVMLSDVYGEMAVAPSGDVVLTGYCAFDICDFAPSQAAPFQLSGMLGNAFIAKIRAGVVPLDATAPQVTLTTPDAARDDCWWAYAYVTDSDTGVGIAGNARAFLDVDLNNDGDFADAGETAYASASVVNGLASFRNLIPLPEGTYRLQVRASDRAGNEGTSAVATTTIDSTRPTVTVNQAADQADPTAEEVIHFSVVFSQPVTDFTAEDVRLAGTATGTLSATVTGSGAVYDVAVRGMVGNGTVVASIVDDAAFDAAHNQSVASTSDDNVVRFHVPRPQSFTLASPAPGTYASGQGVAIQWNAGDVAAGGRISLCYDEDTTWDNGNEHWIEIDGVAAADGVGRFTWNTAGVPTGSYFLAGYLWNGDNTFTLSHVAQPITIGATESQTFVLTGPTSETINADQGVDIRWTAGNLATGGVISLCYDEDAVWNGNEHWIEVDRVAASNGDGLYVWNTVDLPAGSYYLGGYLWDGRGVFTPSRLAQPITIVNQTFSLHPSASSMATTGDPVAIQWTAGNIVAGSKISLCYDEDTTWNNGNEHWIEIDRVTAANGDGSYTWDTKNLPAGTYYVAGYLWSGHNTFTASHLDQSVTIQRQTFVLDTLWADSCVAGDAVTVSWTAGGVISGAKISLCYDEDTLWNGNEHWIEIDRVPADGGSGSNSYVWNTANVPAGSYYVAGYLWNGRNMFTLSRTTNAISVVSAPGAVSSAVRAEALDAVLDELA